MNTITPVELFENEIMTIHDVARYLHLSEAQVYKMVRAGTMPAVRIGKSWRFKKELLDDWIRRQSTLSSKTL